MTRLAPRLVLLGLFVNAAASCSPATEPMTVEEPQLEQGLVATKGALPDPAPPKTTRQQRNPLDAIAPEDPPIPTRALVLYGTSTQEWFGDPKKVKVGKLFDVNAGVADEPGVGMPGAGAGVRSPGTNAAISFRMPLGQPAFTNGGNLTLSDFGIRSSGWTLSFYVSQRQPVGDTDHIATLVFAEGGTPLKLALDNKNEGRMILSGDTVVELDGYVPDDFYHHVSITFSPFVRDRAWTNERGVMHVFFDGERIFSGINTRATLKEVRFGSQSFADLSEALIDEVMVHGTTLTDSEIRALANKPLASLARVWPLQMPREPPAEDNLFVRARANAAISVEGAVGYRRQVTSTEPFGGVELDTLEEYTIAGWFFIPRNNALTTDLFRISGVPKDGSKDLVPHFRLAVRNSVPFVILTEGGRTERYGRRGEFDVEPGTWHFIAFTRDKNGTTEQPGKGRLYLDGHLVRERDVTQGFASFIGTMERRVTYGGGAPVAWVAMYGRALPRQELEALRSPGPRVWLDGSMTQPALAGLYGPSGTTGDVGAAPVPTDYARYCRYVRSERICTSLVKRVGSGGGDAFEFSRYEYGRVEIEAPPAFMGAFGTAFDVTIPGEGRYTLFSRDAPRLQEPGSYFLPTDAKLELVCNGSCVLEVNDGLRYTVPVPNSGTLRVAYSMNEARTTSFLAINGQAVTDSSDPPRKLINAETKTPALPRGRIRWGFDQREAGTSGSGTLRMDNIRFYARELSVIELQSLSGTCDSVCTPIGKDCVSGPSITTTCTTCDAKHTTMLGGDAYGASGAKICEPRNEFLSRCVDDAQCLNGGCSAGLCATRDMEEAKRECDARGRDVGGNAKDGAMCARDCKEYFTTSTTETERGLLPKEYCSWTPPNEVGDIIGYEGKAPDPNKPRFTDNLACDSGHAYYYAENRYSMTTAVVEVQQADAHHMGYWRPTDVNVGASPDYTVTRIKCTPKPTIPECADCNQTPPGPMCLDELREICGKLDCQFCDGRNEQCRRANANNIYCEGCRENHVYQRALLTPQACADVHNSLIKRLGFNPYPIWNDDNYHRLFDHEIPSVYNIKVLLGMGETPVQAKDYAAMEARGVGIAYLRMADTISKNPSREKALLAQYKKEWGGEIRLAACVRSDSAFFSPANDRICVAKKNPNGTACPPLKNDGTPEGGSPHRFCSSGYCGRESKVCEDGGDRTADGDRKDGDENAAGKFDIALFATAFTNDTVIDAGGQKDGKKDMTIHFSNYLKITALGTELPVPMFELSADLQTEDGQAGDYTTTFKIFGVEMPTPEEPKPAAECAGAKWEDGEYKPAARGCEFDPGAAQVGFSTGLKENPLCFPLAEETKDVEVKKKGRKKPKTVQKQTWFGKLKFERTFLAGPVPITIEGQPTAEVCLNVIAGFGEETLEAKVGVKPSMNIGYELRGGVGGSFLGIIGVFAGLRAQIALFELGFPFVYVTSLEQVEGGDGNPVDNLFKLEKRTEISVELKLLGIAFDLFATVDLLFWNVEWSLRLLSFDALSFDKVLHQGPKSEFTLDLNYDFFGTNP